MIIEIEKGKYDDLHSILIMLPFADNLNIDV